MNELQTTPIPIEYLKNPEDIAPLLDQYSGTSTEQAMSFLTQQLSLHQRSIQSTNGFVYFEDNPAVSLLFNNETGTHFTNNGKEAILQRLKRKYDVLKSPLRKLTPEEMNELEGIISTVHYAPPPARHEMKNSDLIYRGTTYGFLLYQLYHDEGQMKFGKKSGSPVSTEPDIAFRAALKQSQEDKRQINLLLEKIGSYIPLKSHLWDPVILKFNKNDLYPDGLPLVSIDNIPRSAYPISLLVDESKVALINFLELKQGSIGYSRLLGEEQNR